MSWLGCVDIQRNACRYPDITVVCYKKYPYLKGSVIGKIADACLGRKYDTVTVTKHSVKPIRSIFHGLKQWWHCAAIGFSILATTVFGMAQNVISSTNEVPVLLVNAEPVGAVEFVWFMQQERAAVFQFFNAKFNLDEGTNFWDRQFSGVTPRAFLQERTVKRIVQAKVEQNLFLELGLVKDIRYQTFLDNLENFNRERESLAQKGGVIYGPVRYTQLQFYEHWMMGWRLRAREQLAQSQWDVSDEKVREFFERHPEQFPHSDITTTSKREKYLESLYSELLASRVKRAKIRVNQAAAAILIQ